MRPVGRVFETPVIKHEFIESKEGNFLIEQAKNFKMEVAHN